jgi:hypothetical protein
MGGPRPLFWPLYAFVQVRWPATAPRWLTLVVELVVGLRWLLLAVVGFHGLSLPSMGL